MSSKKQNGFEPYISHKRVTPELTVSSVVIGVILAVVFGAANAYLGLRVGMTVSASIPAAVISMGVLRVILRRGSVLESNLAQTVGSAGESLAAGAIFTLPALFIWARENPAEFSVPSLLEITLIALVGGLLGVFFMIPLRNALIVKEHGVLPYPEGTACAEVLLAGEQGGRGAVAVFGGMGVAGAFKLVIDGLRAIPGEVSLRLSGYGGEIGTQIYPAVLSVGYICGPRIASYMLAGGAVSWLAIIPLIVAFGSEAVLYPAVGSTVSEIFAQSGASGIWSNYVRYIGAGALAAGGFISLLKTSPLILRTFRDSLRGMRGEKRTDTVRTSQSIGMRWVLIAIGILTLAVWLIPAIPVTLIGAVIVVVFGFFFATVSSRMVGLVGSSNNPVSGMAIATVIIATLILKLTGGGNAQGMTAAIAIGSIICIVSAIAGDTSQDLKAGYILGATPKKQQIGEIIGAVAAALAIGGTLFLLNRAWGFGGEELAAPQATLMKVLVEGVMGDALPWDLIFIGAAIAVSAELAGIPSLPFAIGIYLPIHLSACIGIGGAVRLFLEKAYPFRKRGTQTDEPEGLERRRQVISQGTLFCSGMIAGEGLVGIALAILAVAGLGDALDISEYLSALGLPPALYSVLSLVAFGIVIALLLAFSVVRRKQTGVDKNEK